jgi:hypothetical protein
MTPTIGNAYEARVSGKVTTVRILSKSTYGKGWVAKNEATGREVRILTAARLRPLAPPPCGNEHTIDVDGATVVLRCGRLSGHSDRHAARDIVGGVERWEES